MSAPSFMSRTDLCLTLCMMSLKVSLRVHSYLLNSSHINVILLYIHTGSLALCVKHLLIQCIHEEQLFVLETLNQRLCSFNYGQADSKNRPSPILPRRLSAEGLLKQSGRRVCMCVCACARVCVGEEHPYWNNCCCWILSMSCLLL